MWARRLGRAAPALAGLGLMEHLELKPRSLARCAVPSAPDGATSLSVCTYNLLCPTYALKWKEQQGLHADGTSNWSVRWPVMKDIILRGNFDVLCLQEVESTEADAIAADLGPDYVTRYFKHPPKRPPDGVMIAVKKSCCKAAPSWSEHDYKGFVIFGGAEFQHHSGARVRVANGHMRGFNQEQLREFGAFGTSGTWDLQILTADFNEDFQTESGVRCPFPEEYTTLRRPADLPQVSRPPNKQEAGQSSGKGKIDYIWVRDTQDKPQLFFDEASKRAIIESHRNCEETGEWPSDHGCEACSIRLSPKPWWQFWK